MWDEEFDLRITFEKMSNRQLRDKTTAQKTEKGLQQTESHL